MLRIVMGRTGRLWPEVTAAAARALKERRPFLLVVPEQYTLKAERDLMASLGLEGLFDLAVLSPSRLQKLVFERAGRPERTLLGAQGRRVAVAKALGLGQGELRFYVRAAERPGFISAVADTVSAFRQEGVTGEGLAEAAGHIADPVLRGKLCDVALVMRDYEKQLGDRLTDAEETHRQMLARLERSGVLDHADIAFYGFDVLTPPLREVAAAAAALAEDTLIALVGDKQQAEDGHAFQPVLKSAQRLMKMVQDAGRKCAFSFLPAAPLKAPAAVAHLERHFLGFERPAFQGAVRGIRLLAAATPCAETEFVCQQVLRHLEEGVRPEDILVLAGDIAPYGTLLRSRLAAYRVPCYVSGRTQVASHAVVLLLLSALRCLKDNWQADDVEDMLSSGFCGLDQMDCWRLRRYARSYGIKGGMWTRPFTRGAEDERARAEALRQRLTPPVMALHAALRSASSAYEAIQAVLRYLETLGVYEAVARLQDEMAARGMPEAAARTRQVWARLMETFEQMELVLGGDRIPLTRFAAWLEAALTDIDVSALPPAAGCVEVGEIGRVPVGKPAVVFLVGLSDAFLTRQEDALLSDDEMHLIEEGLDMSIRLTGQEAEKLRLLDLWKAMAAPREALYLSYPLADDTGAPQRALSRLSAVRQLLPGLVEEGGAFFTGEAAMPVAPGPALETAAERLRAGTLDGVWQEAWTWLKGQEMWRDKAMQVAAAARGDERAPALAPDTARRLFHLDTASVTRLETFASCPYRHFVMHGLKPEEKKEWRVGKNDAGVLYHSALELFARRAAQDGQWPLVSRERSDEMMLEAMAPLTEGWEDKPFGDTGRARALSDGYIETCKLAAWNLTEGFRYSAFRPGRSEMAFGEAGGANPILLTLSDGTVVRLRGKIDRVDTCETAGERYLRIVDYKSGATAFSAADVYAGLQLQLLIYLQAALTAEKGARPAGLFYQKVDNPLLPAQEDMTAEEAEGLVKRALKMNGLALNDLKVYKLMDSRDPPVSIDALFNRDGQPGANKPVLSGEEMQALMRFAYRKASEIAGDMRKGTVEALPVRDSNGFGPCAYCEYQGICRRDPLLEQKTRRKENISIRQLIERCQNEQP